MGDRPYQIQGDQIIFDWLAREPDMNRRQIFLDWLAGFAMDPESCAQSVPGVYLGYLAVVPLRPPPHASVEFVLVEQFRTIVVTKVKSLR